jgi:DNA-binding response OmpR family regulator
MYEIKLKAAGYRVTVKPDGISGWKHLNEAKYPDLLLLDVVLPGKDGFEILKDIRRHPGLKSLPVILLTNLAQKVDQAEGQKLGADAYVVKAHITPVELIDIVAQVLTQTSLPSQASQR